MTIGAEYNGPMVAYVLVMANGTFLPRQRPHQPRQLPADLMKLGKPGEAKRWLTEYVPFFLQPLPTLPELQSRCSLPSGLCSSNAMQA